jgi:hypothetical protein
MLNSLPAPILLDIAIFFTALSWGLGFYIVDRKPHIFASLAIGCFVCLLGYSVASLGAPIWAVIAAPGWKEQRAKLPHPPPHRANPFREPFHVHQMAVQSQPVHAWRVK